MLGRFEWNFGGEVVVGDEDGTRMYEMPTSQASLAHNIKASKQLSDVSASKDRRQTVS
jgi:hypothetical protein